MVIRALNASKSRLLTLTFISQHVVQDPVVSNRHLRIYTIIFENDKSNDVAPLVYAEDVSRNGTYWNGSVIRRGSGGVLLSDGDTLRISSRVTFQFQRCPTDEENVSFDLVQEAEMKVRQPFRLAAIVLRFGSISRKSTVSPIGN
jgi:FHA domain